MAFFQCSVARAADWSVSPGIDLTEEYNSNVLFSSRSRIGDFVTFIKPRVLAAWETERTRLLFRTAVTGEIYADHSDLDSVSNDTQASLEHHWTPRLYSTVTATFKRDETLDEELQDVGLVTRREERYRYGFNASGGYALTESWSLEAGAGFLQTTYPDDTFDDLMLVQTSVSPSFQINPRDRVGVRFGVDFADYEDTAEGETFSAMAFWRRDLSETSFFKLGAGYQYSMFDREVQVPRIVVGPNGLPTLVFVRRTVETNQSGFSFDFALNNEWTPRFSTVASAGRLQYYDVNARLITRTYVRGSSTYRITELLSLRCDLGYDFNEEEGPAAEDTDYLRGASFLTWKLTENLSLRTGGSIEYALETRGPVEDSKTRVRGSAALVCDWPRWMEGQ
jgi:hypothetical protein